MTNELKAYEKKRNDARQLQKDEQNAAAAAKQKKADELVQMVSCYIADENIDVRVSQAGLKFQLNKPDGSTLTVSVDGINNYRVDKTPEPRIVLRVLDSIINSDEDLYERILDFLDR